MAVTLAASATQTSVDGTTHTLATMAEDPHLYILTVDVNAVAAGERVTLVINTITLIDGTARQAYKVVLQGAQGNDIHISPPVPANISFSATLLHNGGTGTFPWSILRVDG